MKQPVVGGKADTCMKLVNVDPAAQIRTCYQRVRATEMLCQW